MLCIPKTISRQLKAIGNFDMIINSCLSNFDLSGRSMLDDAMVFKKPGQKGHFTL